MLKQKKVPLRKCIGCNEIKAKKEMIRIVRSPSGDVNIDTKGKMPGRGCYICPNINCLESAVKAKRIEKALEASIDSEIVDKLREQLKGNE